MFASTNTPQNHFVHHRIGLAHALVGADRVLREAHALPERHVLAREHALQLHALLQAIPPAHDAVPHDALRLQHGALEDRRVLHHAALAQLHILPQHHVRTHAAVRSHLRRRMLRVPPPPLPHLQHVPLRPVRLHELALVHQLLRRALQAAHVRQIERGALQIVARLPDVHPEPAENHPVQLLVLRHLREDLALDRRWLVLRVRKGKRGNGDATDHRGVEQIDTRVDVVPHVFFGLLNEALDAALG